LKSRRFSINKRVGNEQLVREVDRKRHRELLMAAMTALALALAVLAYAWQHFEMIRIGYRVEELRIERESLLRIRRHLVLEKASLVSPDRVESIALGELGLTHPSFSQVTVIETRADNDAESRDSGNTTLTDLSVRK
jgi:cell division protein FtsL